MNNSITVEQLARLYQARNEANKRMSQATRAGDKTVIRLATSEATNFNRAYAAALRGYKRQQKAASRSAATTAAIKFYLDKLESNNEHI